MPTRRSALFTALFLLCATPLACNTLSGVEDLRVDPLARSSGQGAGDPTGSSGEGGATSSAATTTTTTGTGMPDPMPEAMVAATGVALTKISLYQGVERKLMEKGAAVTSKVPSVAGRPAVVRVFFTVDGSYDKSAVTARLTLDGGKPIEIVKVLSGTSKDSSLTSTLNFDIPAANMAPGQTVRVELLQPAAKSAGNNPAASFPATGSADLKVQSAGPSLKVTLVPIVYQADGSNRKPDTSAAQLKAYEDAFYTTYPIPKADITVHAPVNWGQAVSPNGNGWGELLDGVAQLRAQDGAAAEVYYYGIFSPAGSDQQYCNQGCVAGLGMVASPGDSYSHAAIGLGFSGAIATETAIHEIGHTQGRNHADCGGAQGIDPGYPYPGASIGSWGYNLLTKKLYSPQSYTDMMGYCQPIWISDYTFTAIFKRVKLTNNASFEYPEGSLDRTYERVRIDADGKATWLAPITLHTPPMSETVTLTVHGPEGSEQLEGQLYPYDHLGGGVLMWPVSPRVIEGLELDFEGAQLHVHR